MKKTLEALKGRIDVRVELEFDPEMEAFSIHAIKGEMHLKHFVDVLEITNARDPGYFDRIVADKIEEMP